MITITLSGNAFDVDPDGRIFTPGPQTNNTYTAVREIASGIYLDGDWRRKLSKIQRKLWQEIRDIPPRKGAVPHT